MTSRPSPSESARLLRQRLEMGATDLVLEGMTRDEALALIAAARRTDDPVTSGQSDPARPAGSSTDDGRVGPDAHMSDRAERPPTDATGAGSRTTGTPVRSGAGADSANPSGSTGKGRPVPGSSAAAASSPASSVALPVLPDDYDALRDLALGCTACGLSKSRSQVVFSDGPRDASLMVVGEAPGANEDETGLPFVGAAGKYLDLLLATVDLSREESVYIANVLKCRPPGNRNPTDLEIETCSPYLRKQIDLVAPRALLAVGSFSGKLLTGQSRASLGSLRGTVHSYHGVPLVVTYHPAALLRNPRWTRLLWDDLQLLREVIDSG